MENKIIQMWEDSTHETALYPTSVAEAIKWDSNQTIAQYIANNVGFYGIDTSRVIATNPTMPYVATEDCFSITTLACNTSAGYFTTIYVDGSMVSRSNNTNSGYVIAPHIIPLKKGQTLIVRRGNGGTESDQITNADTKVFGVKGGNS